MPHAVDLEVDPTWRFVDMLQTFDGRAYRRWDWLVELDVPARHHPTRVWVESRHAAEVDSQGVFRVTRSHDGVTASFPDFDHRVAEHREHAGTLGDDTKVVGAVYGDVSDCQLLTVGEFDRDALSRAGPSSGSVLESGGYLVEKAQARHSQKAVPVGELCLMFDVPLLPLRSERRPIYLLYGHEYSSETPVRRLSLP